MSREFNRLVFADTTGGCAASSTTTCRSRDLFACRNSVAIFRATCIAGPVDAPGLPEGPARVLVDGDALGACVKIRSWKPGDYYKPAGWPAGKVKKLFQRARVPRSQRGRWPLFATDSSNYLGDFLSSFPRVHSQRFLQKNRSF